MFFAPWLSRSRRFLWGVLIGNPTDNGARRGRRFALTVGCGGVAAVWHVVRDHDARRFSRTRIIAACSASRRPGAF